MYYKFVLSIYSTVMHAVLYSRDDGRGMCVCVHTAYQYTQKQYRAEQYGGLQLLAE